MCTLYLQNHSTRKHKSSIGHGAPSGCFWLHPQQRRAAGQSLYTTPGEEEGRADLTARPFQRSSAAAQLIYRLSWGASSVLTTNFSKKIESWAAWLLRNGKQDPSKVAFALPNPWDPPPGRPTPPINPAHRSVSPAPAGSPALAGTLHLAGSSPYLLSHSFYGSIIISFTGAVTLLTN